MINLGIVDFDTSHVVEFTKRLHRTGVPEDQWVGGARVVAGWPGASQMMPERIGPYTEQLREMGVEIVDGPEALIGRVNGVLVESQQGSAHLDRARPFLEAGLPLFVDKPFANSVHDARDIARLAALHRSPVFSSSSLRFTPDLVSLLDDHEGLGSIHGADVWAPAATHTGNPWMP